MDTFPQLLPYDGPSVADLCQELDEWRRRLDARGTLLRRWEGRLRRELEASAVGASVGLEQVPVTVDEVRRILAGDRPASVSREDAALVTGYRDAMSFVLRRADDPGFRWDRELVVGLHDRILAGQYAEGAGRLRERDVWLTNAASGEQIFLPPPEADVAALVDEMCIAIETRDAHPAAISAWVHVACAAIHPFRDGNGRTARVLASLGMYRGGFRRPEFTSLEEWWGRYPASYYAAFECLGRQFDRNSDVTPFVRAHVEAQLSQVRALDLKERAESQIWVAVENVATARGLAPRVANALWDAFLGREIVAGYYREIAEVSAQTATNDLSAATAARLLRAQGERRGRRYTAGQDLAGEVGAALGIVLDPDEKPGDEMRSATTRAITERLISGEQGALSSLIIGAWREAERDLERTATRHGLAVVAGGSSLALVRQLATNGVIDNTAAQELIRLGDFRNRVVHADGLPVGASDAFAFVRNVKGVIDRMALKKSLRREAGDRILRADPSEVPDDPADLKREIADAHDRFGE